MAYTCVILGSQLELKNPKTSTLLYQNIKEFSQKVGEEAIVLKFGSKQSLQKQSLFTWFIVPASSVVVQ